MRQKFAISIHALLAESDVVVVLHIIGGTDFYPRSPCGERRPTANTGATKHGQISIHALLAESDTNQTNLPNEISDFYPRSPCGERLRHAVNLQPETRFLSTLSLRRATRFGRPIDVQLVFLSTLSLRRATIVSVVLLMSNLYFYPRSPCGERQQLIDKRCEFARFLSTLSLRRATTHPITILVRVKISIHALLAESDSNKLILIISPHSISIHALLAESDTPMTFRHCTTYLFLSTLSLRRATAIDVFLAVWAVISIHALLAESDRHKTPELIINVNFYPRSPCGERLRKVPLLGIK